MTTEKVNDLEIIKLSDYFSAKTFRLVPTDAGWEKGGISEVPITFNLHYDFSTQLSFNIGKLQKLYGFSIMGKKLVELNESPYYGPKYQGVLKEVELNDCGILWIVKFGFSNKKDKLYATHADEVMNLLNSCRRPLFIV